MKTLFKLIGALIFLTLSALLLSKNLNDFVVDSGRPDLQVGQNILPAIKRAIENSAATSSTKSFGH